MKKEKQQSMINTYRQFREIGLNNDDSGVVHQILDEKITGFGTAIDEKIQGINGVIDLLKIQKEQTKGLAITWHIDSVSQFISDDENTAVFSDDVFMNITTADETLTMYMRLSVVLHYQNNQWKVIHWHASKPEHVESEKDTWGIESWKQKAEELEALVAEKTAHLIEKNRELEVEAALERVRAITMAMHSSADVGKCVVKMFSELTALGVDEGTRFGIGILNHENENNQLWTARKTGAEVNMHIGYLKMNWHPLLKSARKAWKAQVPFHKYVLEGEDLLNYYQMLNTAPDYKIQIPLEQLPEREIQHCFIFEHGFFYAFSPGEFTPELIHITKRFSALFEQTYTRFLDLQKAEAQAREAQIQLALERVRARTMAMQSSEELAEVSYLLNKQVVDLGIPTRGCAFNIYNEHDSTEWFSNLEGTLPAYKTPRENIFLKYYEAGQRGETLWIEEFGKERIKQHYDYLHSLRILGDDEEVVEKLRQVDFQIDHVAYFKYGYLLFITLVPAPEAHEVFQRFAKEFEQTYTRFLDLQKAEAQAREAQIEAALERVRARSMGMHKSDDLIDVVREIGKGIHELGIQLHYSQIYTDYIYDRKTGLNIWLDVEGQDYLEKFHLPYIDHTITLNYHNALNEGLDYFSERYSKAEKDSYFKLLFKYSDLKRIPKKRKELILNASGWARFTVILNEATLNFGRYNLDEFTDEEHEIFIRFATVFGQAYTRFLDLKKAEEQAREAQIETALERVRSRTMAMQSSDELAEAASEMFGQIEGLGLNPWSCGFNIFNHNKTVISQWVSSGDGRPIEPFDTPADKDIFKRFTAKSNTSEPLYIEKQEGKKLEDMYSYMASLPGLDKIFDELKVAGIALPKKQVNHAAYFKQGYLLFITYDETPEFHSIFKRFAKVFEQTYTRFLDLKKAEAQAREAKIEAALEKVRSRTMAMQNSNELPEAANNLFLQVQELGIPAWSAGYCIWKEDQKSATAFMSSEGVIQKPFVLPTIGIGYDFSEPFKKGEVFHVEELGGKLIHKHYEFMRTLPIFGEVIDGILEAGHPLPTFQIFHICYFKYGYVMFITYETVPKAHNIFKRFAKVFEQTYTRFLDLKKAEAQAREAQIEAALEKVRSRSLAMQSPNELIEVAQLLREEMGALGVEALETSSIYIHDQENDTTQCWFTIKNEKDGKSVSDQMTIDLKATWVGRKMQSFYKSSSPSTSIVMTGKHRVEWIQYCEKQSTHFSTSKFYGDTIPTRTYHLNKFSDGFIGAAAPGDISEESWDLLKRATAVFSFAYTRFRDLQNAEMRAREAQIEMALEKVRSRTMTMAHSSELADTSVIVFKELLNLGIAPNRLFIGIIKDKGKAIEAWATNEDGSKIEKHFQLYPSENKSIQKMVDAWKQEKKSTIIDMSGKELKDYFYYLNTVMQIPFIHGLQQKRRVQTIAYFSGGLIGMAAPEEQPQETIDLLERFAAVFNLTYTRFNDLKIAEKQAVQAEKDLIAIKQAREKAEAALKELQATQSQLVQQEKLASLGQLTAGIAHEIKNPLNFVTNFSDLSRELIDEVFEALDEPNNPENSDEIRELLTVVKSNLEKIYQHGTRADSIVKSMLQHSRGGSGKMEPTDLNALVQEYVNLAFHGMRAGKKPINVAIDLQLDPNIAKISLIGEDFSRVILNLCNNAFDAMRTHGDRCREMGTAYNAQLKVCTTSENGLIRIKVTDNGCGIPDDIKDKILQPFFTTKKGTEGTGLGLSITHDIVKAHGGSLTVISLEGKGSEFSLTLPALA
ncbi:ATP-binding protein [Arenibacter sp. GZD96]|uniref:ATP-binding protein n=1 Tax=Aurantibrevibacter litoralis TaxID=3106030 RepID=UPI002B00152A|nr:ATP-binding protein [Arenibacter sp. GZD-96]MEA1786059.1 ATP-binding protein [Arenibacter sp. GZD-96]